MTGEQAFLKAREILLKNGLENGDFEARQMLFSLLSISPSEWLLCKGDSLAPSLLHRLEEWLTKRADGIPLQYLLGEWDFYGRTFQVGIGVLIPRSDTETLIDAVKGDFSFSSSFTAVDLCSGTGCIGLTLAAEFPRAKVTCVEKEEQALFYLEKNRLSKEYHWGETQILKLDVTDPKEVAGQSISLCWDVLVANPPYLTQADMETRQREVSFEPETALYAKDNGLYFYKKISSIWKSLGNPGSRIYFEVGAGQAKSVAAILEQNGFEEIRFWRDLQGILRVVGGKKACSNGKNLL